MVSDSLDQVMRYALKQAPIKPARGRTAGSGHSPLPESLTPRETEVLSLVALGLSDAQVAEKLVISVRTVHTHLSSIYSKLAVNSRTAAVRVATDNKLIQLNG